jgi:site-specific DNA recombinase
VRNPSLLAGLLFDAAGQRMTPTHAIKHGKRYRYYVSRPLIINGRDDAATGQRIPAAEIEQIVVNRIRRLLLEPASLSEILRAQAGQRLLQQSLIARAAAHAADWASMPVLRQRVILLALVRRVEVGPDQVTIHLRPDRLAAFLKDRLDVADPVLPDDEPSVLLSHPVRLRRAGKEVRIVIDGSDPFAPSPRPDPSLIKAIVKAHRFNERLVHGGVTRFADLAKDESLHRSYYSQILRLAYLAPDITTAILEGHQPAGLTATMLVEHPRLPLSWQQQRTALGFA